MASYLPIFSAWQYLAAYGGVRRSTPTFPSGERGRGLPFAGTSPEARSLGSQARRALDRAGGLSPCCRFRFRSRRVRLASISGRSITRSGWRGVRSGTVREEGRPTSRSMCWAGAPIWMVGLPLAPLGGKAAPVSSP
jgi:hypothetical protein